MLDIKEIKQRLHNCKNMLRFAWYALTYDSKVFGYVIFSSFSAEFEKIKKDYKDYE